MVTTRLATPADAPHIARHRQQMFADTAQAGPESTQLMAANFIDWVSPRLADGRYLGWLFEDQGQIVAGAGLWLVDFPPHWMDPQPIRAYLLNFFVEPSHRGQGLAQQMVDLTVAEARRRGVRVVSLHASTMGRPIYERNGFEPTNEMILRLDFAE